MNFFHVGLSRWLLGISHSVNTGFQEEEAELPEIFNAWAQNSQKAISSTFYLSKQKRAQLRLTERACKLQLLMGRVACVYKKVKLGNVGMFQD